MAPGGRGARVGASNVSNTPWQSLASESLASESSVSSGEGETKLEIGLLTFFGLRGDVRRLLMVAKGEEEAPEHKSQEWSTWGR